MTSVGTATPTPVTATHRGVEYAGEFLRVEQWRPSLGELLTGDAYFRIVFIETPAAVFPRALHDHRVAVYVPSERTPELDRAESDLRILREAMGSYATDVEPLDMLSAKTEAIENLAVGAWAESFRNGHLIAAPALDADLDAIFADGYWSAWAERIGVLLLERAYPDPPFNDSLFSIPLRPEADVPLLFDALMTGEGKSADFAVESFAPGLGLTSPAAPRTVDLTVNPVAHQLMSMTQENWPPDAIGQALAHEQGLTYPVATLYLLLWIRDGHHSARLRPGHGLLRRDGQRYLKDTIASTDIPDLRWPIHIWDRIESLQTADEAIDVDPYLAAIAGPIGQDESATDAAERRLSELRDDLAETARALQRLATAQRSSDPLIELDHLHDIGEAQSADDAVLRASLLEHDPAVFAVTMDLWRAWSRASAFGDALGHAAEWLEAAVVDQGAADLSVEREALLGRLRARRLLRAPHEWSSIADSVAAFKRRYAEAYLAAHDAYHAAAGLLAHEVDSTERKARALDMLNEIAELGHPVGVGLAALASELRNRVAACGLERTTGDVAVTARCPSCGIGLGAEPPTNEVKQLSALVDEALATQNRRLGTVIAHRLIDRQRLGELDTFIDIVRVGDLSGLAEILDDKIAELIRSLLRNNASA